MKDAHQRLEGVKMNLEHKSGAEFGGHKGKAIEAINQAMEHLNQAIKFAEEQDKDINEKK